MFTETSLRLGSVLGHLACRGTEVSFRSFCKKDGRAIFLKNLFSLKKKCTFVLLNEEGFD
jgi:hypothetical protein